MSIRSNMTFAASVLLVSATTALSQDYAISIDQTGACGAGSAFWTEIAGTTAGADPSRHAVVIYAVTDKAYVQPYTARPLTTIGSDGTWQTDTHGGFNYWALLVEQANFDPPSTTTRVPEGPAVLAVAKAACIRQ